MGLRSKFLVMLMALLVLPILILSTLGALAFKQRLYDDALGQQRSVAESVASNVLYEVKLTQSLFKNLTQNGVLAQRVSEYVSAPSAQGAVVIQSALKELVADEPLLMEAGIYGLDAQFIEPSLTRSNRYQTFWGFPRQMPEVEWPGLVVHVESSPQTGGYGAFRVLLRLSDPSGSEAGYLALHVTSQKLQQIIKSQASDKMDFFLSDDVGTLLARSSGVALHSIPAELFLLGNAERGRLRFLEKDLDGHSSQFSMTQISHALWFGSQLNLDALNHESSEVLAKAMAVIAALVALAALFFYVQFSRLVIVPIDHLIDVTKKISIGDYRPKIDIASSDEIGELAEAFRTMGAQLNDSNEKIRQLAFFDPLTKLPNRETLLYSLKNLIDTSERNHTLLGILFIDLDDFKKVNDRLGHSAGDELLVVVGERLINCLRSSDVVTGNGTVGEGFAGEEALVSRRGGDEFNAIISGVSSARDIALIAERLISDINEPVTINGSQVNVGASIGVAIFPFDGADADTLLHNADLAMYEAKALGKNKYYLFAESINTQVHERLEMEQRITMGLRRSEFELYFQPKILLQSMRIGGFEALIRWKNPEEGLVSPAEFIPLAEESQLIHDIGRWVIAEAFDHIQVWQHSLPEGVRVAINVSARQVAQESFAENFISLAEQFDVPLTRIEIELTETSILTDETLVIQHLHRLRKAGVSVSLDDFGTGYSSLTFLRNLPIDSVKIDRSFVSRLEEDQESKEIIASVLELCQKLKLDTVAEGVETEAQAEYLTAHGCTQGQGYLFSRPMPSEEVIDFLGSPKYLNM